MSQFAEVPGPPPPSLELESAAEQDGRFRCAIWENVSLLLWIGQATGDSVRALRQVSATLARRYPRGHSSVSFIPAGLPLPTDEAREELAVTFDDRLDQISCMAQVLEGQGFWASTLRSTITNMNMNASGTMAMRACSSIAEVAAWLPEPHRERTGVVLHTEHLGQILQRFRDGFP